MPKIELVSTSRKQIAYFRRTDHCGKCGDPGTYCRCRDTDPCACRHLHVMGSAFLPGAVNTYRAPDVDDDDGGLVLF